MSNQIPDSLRGLRVRLVTPASENSPPVEQQAYKKLKKLLSKHGQHISPKALELFRQSLNGLLLHGLRARQTETPAVSDSGLIYFKTSDGKMYKAPSKAWSAILKADPGAKKYVASSKHIYFLPALFSVFLS